MANNDEQSPQPEVFEPWQVAQMLGISTTTLARMRRDGKIQGRRTGTSTVYTMEQIKAADLNRNKPGPKAGEGSRIGRAKYSWPTGNDSSSVVPTGNDSSSVASIRKRSTSARPDVLLLVGA